MLSGFPIMGRLPSVFSLTHLESHFRTTRKGWGRTGRGGNLVGGSWNVSRNQSDLEMVVCGVGQNQFWVRLAEKGSC